MQAGSFSTVEGFWKNYVHLKRPSSIGNNVNVYLFRDALGHVPMWEVCSHVLLLLVLSFVATPTRCDSHGPLEVFVYEMDKTDARMLSLWSDEVFPSRDKTTSSSVAYVWGVHGLRRRWLCCCQRIVGQVCLIISVHLTLCPSLTLP